MNSAIITDQHLDGRKGSQAFWDFFLKFYNEVFFPTLEKNNIKILFDLGDTFDNRKQIDFLAWDRIKKNYYDRLQEMGVQIHMIVGNHTAYYKNTNRVNTPTLLLDCYDNITIYDEICDIDVLGNTITMIPWINSENQFKVMNHLENTKSEVLMGHWDNYFYNKNNYFLYHRSSDNRFVYIPYDMDNTFGIQWGVPDIQKRNIHAWGNLSSSKSPLTYKILGITRWKMAYEQEIRDLIDDAYDTDSLFSIIDNHKTIVSTAIAADPYFKATWPSDYGFTVSDWQQSDTKAWGNHVSFGVKPFISERTTTALQQMIYPSETVKFSGKNLGIYPNPANDRVYSPAFAGKTICIYHTTGTLVKKIKSVSSEISVADLSVGTYIIDVQSIGKTILLIRH